MCFIKSLIWERKVKAHNHNHHHHKDISGSRLFVVMVLNFTITVAEIIGGIVSGSLALLSDALHNFSDGLSVVVTYIAFKFSKKDTTYNYTFGYKQAEIIAAILNSLTLIGISFYLFYEAINRFRDPITIRPGIMISVSLLGLFANTFSVFLLEKDAHKSLNIRSSYLHLLSDAISSLGVVIGGIFIYLFNIYWIDPIVTIGIAIYVLKEGKDIIINSFYILMQRVPKDIDIEKISDEIKNISPIIKDVHHIHIWQMGEHERLMEAHINMDDVRISKANEIGDLIRNMLKEKFNITHITLQFEHERCRGEGLIKRKIA